MKKQKNKDRFYDFMASLCFVFDVDWDAEYPDDDYVIAYRRAESEAKNQIERSVTIEIPKLRKVI